MAQEMALSASLDAWVASLDRGQAGSVPAAAMVARILVPRLPVEPTFIARRALAAMDLTSLNESDGVEDIRRLCASAHTPAGSVAAVCVYPEMVAVARAALAESPVRVATVVNFPDGGSDPARVARECRRALAAGAHEIDVVMPYAAWLAGDAAGTRAVLTAAREACADQRLKVILETGVLQREPVIRAAARLAIECGADFIKTSTGKVPINATLDAARWTLDEIADSGRACGFKAAGGIRSIADAAGYFALADARFGADWASPARFRLGASSLLADVLRVLGGAAEAAAGGGY